MFFLIGGDEQDQVACDLDGYDGDDLEGDHDGDAYQDQTGHDHDSGDVHVHQLSTILIQESSLGKTFATSCLVCSQ